MSAVESPLIQNIEAKENTPITDGNDIVINSIGMELKLIPAGKFLMGWTAGDESPQHRVRITKPFYMQTTEVTQGQWRSVMNTEPWKGKPYVREGADYPVTYVSWNEAVDFCEKLSEREDATYRLPTEAEWEYSCRANTDSAYSFGNRTEQLAQYGWYLQNARDAGEELAHIHIVAQKRANNWGLYDMHGNVCEWCSDWYHNRYYANSPVNDPQAPSEGWTRVLRGGGWKSRARDCRSSNRMDNTPADRGPSMGFRIVRSSGTNAVRLSKAGAKNDRADSAPGMSAGAPAAVTPTKPRTKPAVTTEEAAITNSMGMSLGLIPAGEFLMGSPDGIGDAGERPQHRVRITKPFYMQTTEVTQQQWASVFGRQWKGATYAPQRAEYPVSTVTWAEAVEFCKQLSQREDATYRLPTEAEWEYACRAGSPTAYSFGDPPDQIAQYAWCKGNADYAHPVGRKRPNAFGLYDMHGNVYEWCSDWYSRDYYKESPTDDPQGPPQGNSWVSRGGCAGRGPEKCRSAARAGFLMTLIHGGQGFRVVREVKK